MPGRRPDGGWWHEPSRRLPGKGAIRGRAPFGATWWGRAWVDALENRARLDPNRLPRGRTYARGGAVEQIEIAKGRVAAFVQGSRSTPYKVSIGVHQFSAAEWESVFGALSAEVGRAAALLDGELPPEIAEELRGLGLDLLPGPGSLKPRCSCPDWADPCKHSAAVCYLVSDALDEDPFALFLMRGRSRDELMSALRARRAAGLQTKPGNEARRRAAGEKRPQTIRPSEAWARQLAPLPALPLPPRSPGYPTVLAADPPADCGVTSAGLRMLAEDAAERAWSLANGLEVASVGTIAPELEVDIARWASRLADSGDDAAVAALAERAGVPVRELSRRADAWRDGGRPGLEVLDSSFPAADADVAAARAHLASTVPSGTPTSVRLNRVTAGSRQLRIGRDGRWYPYAKARDGTFRPAGGPIDPADLPAQSPAQSRAQSAVRSPNR